MLKKQFNVTSTKQIKCSDERQLLLEGRARVLRKKASYELYRLKRSDDQIYYLRCVYDRECSECYVFCDRAQANKLFFALLRGRVTPCNMRYIVDELTYDPENNVIDSI